MISGANGPAGSPAQGGIFPLLVLTAALWPGPAPAHHSFASIYDTSKSVTITGSVREFQFVHPHPFLVVEVRGNTGERQAWRAETDNRFELEDIGMTESTFRPGDEVVVSGSPGRRQSTILYMWRLERAADGLLYRQTGGTPSLNKAGVPDRASVQPSGTHQPVRVPIIVQRARFDRLA